MPRKYLVLITVFSIVKLAVHFAANANYGLHADELYYIALSKHPQWGYLDNSPLIAFITRFSGMLFGTSAFAYRVLPTFFSCFTVFLTGLTAYHLGGKKLAVSISCMAMLCSPALLATSYFLQPVVFEHFFWTAGILLLLRYFGTGKPVFIYACAAVTGAGFLNKYTIIIYAAAVFAGTFISGERKIFRSRHLYLSLLLFLIIISPNLLWQARHHFPAVRYVSVVQEKNDFKGMGDYIFQFIFFHGAGVAVWLAGLGFVLLNKALRSCAFIAWAFILTLAVLVLLQGKIYYGLGAFPVLFAAGGVCWEIMLRKAGAFWRYNLFVILVLPALIALPAVIPVLPLKTTLRYFNLMTTYTSITQPLRWDDGRPHPISQFYADMLGWNELSRITALAVSRLNKAQRNNGVILTENYGITGALSYYGHNSHMPVIAPNSSFILWSPQTLDAKYVIYVSRKKQGEVVHLAETSRLVGTVQNRFAREKGTSIYLLYKPSRLLRQNYRQQITAFTGSRGM